MKKGLKIYVVEDSKSKIKQMEKYFNGVNYLLSPTEDIVKCYQDSEKTLREHEYEQVVLEKVETDNEETDYYNFDSGKNRDFLQKIKKVIQTEENRIFIMDLALNAKERADFQINQNRLIAKTAKEILNIIKSSMYKEVVVISSYYAGIEDEYLLVLGISKEELANKITIKFLPGNVFNDCNVEKEMVIVINDVFREIFEEKE